MDQLMGALLLVGIISVSIAAMLAVGLPTIDTSKSSSSLNDAQNAVLFIDNAVKEVASEGKGASRFLQVSSPGSFLTIPEEDAVEFEVQTRQEIGDYLSRSIQGNIVQINGNDVACSDKGILVMENSYLKAAFRMVNATSSIKTSESLISLQQKTTGSIITAANSSIIIDDNPSTSSGTGYSEILRTGNNLPSCTVHLFVNSTVVYDVYYTLYAGADFIVGEVRNVRP